MYYKLGYIPYVRAKVNPLKMRIQKSQSLFFIVLTGFAYMSEGQYTRKMNEKLSEDYCMNVAEIFSKTNETYVNLMIREQTTNH